MGQSLFRFIFDFCVNYAQRSRDRRSAVSQSGIVLITCYQKVALSLISRYYFETSFCLIFFSVKNIIIPSDKSNKPISQFVASIFNNSKMQETNNSNNIEINIKFAEYLFAKFQFSIFFIPFYISTIICIYKYQYSTIIIIKLSTI